MYCIIIITFYYCYITKCFQEKYFLKIFSNFFCQKNHFINLFHPGSTLVSRDTVTREQARALKKSLQKNVTLLQSKSENIQVKFYDFLVQ